MEETRTEPEKSQPINFLRKRGVPEEKLRLRNILNIIFIILAILTILVYFVIPMPAGRFVYFIVGMLAVGVKIAEVSIRQSVLKKKKK